MSNTFPEQIEGREQSPISLILNVVMAPLEAQQRAHITALIATISARENWKLSDCAAVSRRVEQAPAASLDAIGEYLRARCEGPTRSDPLNIPEHLFDNPITAVGAAESGTPNAPTPQIAELYGRLRALESRVASAPGATWGIQGIRLMRVVALMSKARSAKLARVRIDGTQAIYQHV